VGLWAFFYATLHLLTYVFLFSGYDVPTAMEGLRAGHLAEPWRQLKLIWPAMLDDVKKRRFIQVGLGAWTILLALAVTSPLRVLRAMGGKNWQRLHRLIYVAGWLAITHYWWQVKKGVLTPWKMTVVLVVLLLARVVWSVWRRMKGSKTLAATGA
jgi:sulfoxide reductase heme-binding subunit YedZ